MDQAPSQPERTPRRPRPRRTPRPILSIRDLTVEFQDETRSFKVLDGLTLDVPRMAYDLPAGGRRLIQGASGYDATIVSGVVTRRHGVDTGARPGALLRGVQPSAPLRGVR